MASLLEKVSTLISANLHYMVDQALKSNSLAVIDQYIRQVQNNLEELEDAAAIDGATHWQTFRHVTVPLARRALLTEPLFRWPRLSCWRLPDLRSCDRSSRPAGWMP